MDSEQQITSDELEGEAFQLPEIPSFPLDKTTTIILLLIAAIPLFLRILFLNIFAWLSRRRRGKTRPSLTPVVLNRAKNLNGKGVRNTNSTPRYGLALGEALSEGSDDDKDDDDDDLTTRELRKLERSTEFAAWCRQQKLQEKDLESIYCRMRTFQRLRKIHPPSFWLLCRPDTLLTRETQELGTFLSLIEYILSVAINIGILAFLGWCAWEKAPQTYWAACIACAFFFYIRCWVVNGRPTAGPFFSVWYEDVVWGHGVSAVRAVLANVFETFYLAGTFGIGGIASLFLRWRDGQSVGEKLVGIRPVIEKKVRIDR